jgi:hypothetical protein
MTMAGLADLLFGTRANTGAGSQPATQNGLDTSTLQAASPWGNGTNFNTGTRRTCSSRLGSRLNSPRRSCSCCKV